jgi:hypothetical protein
VSSSTDWAAWRAGYDDPDSPLSRRRRSVQRCLHRWLDEAPSGPLRVVSACSGDGRDLLEVLARHADAPRIHARLLEVDQGLAARAQKLAGEQGLDQVEVVRADAGCTDAYSGAVPADLVMWCGVFGNLSHADVAATIDVTRSLASPGAHVIWTRGRFADRDPVEPTDAIRAWFAESGFEEVSLDRPEDSPYRVGMHRFVGAPAPLELGRTFFRFLR